MTKRKKKRKQPNFLIPKQVRAQERRYVRLFTETVDAWSEGVLAEVERRLERRSLLDAAVRHHQLWIVDDVTDDLYDYMSLLWATQSAELIGSGMPGVMAEVHRVSRNNWLNTVSRVTNVPMQVVDPIAREPWLEREMKARTTENVNLIKDVGDKSARNIARFVNEDVRSGVQTKEIIKKVQKELGVSKRRAQVIGRDQPQKFLGALHQNRQQDAGVTEYIWKDSGDVRVRPKHQEYNGNKYRWDSPPSDGHPGQPILCRCVASPVIPASLYDLPVDEKYLDFEEY